MDKNERLYVDVHVLQTLPPSCVNRDDTGSPKTAIYGGVTRARVSSQSWKRAVRKMFMEIFPKEELGIRTKQIVAMVAKEIKTLGYEGDSVEAAQRILETAGLKIKSTEKGTDALFFLSAAQAKKLAELAVNEAETISQKPAKEAKTKAHEALAEYPSIDIALFGRMVADDPSLNNDACVQVAHGISTHRISNEYDYFTAVDDLASEDNAGAGHIGTVEFNSSTLYRYATIAVHELYKQLDGETANAVKGFVEAFILSMPTGKQNTFANRTLPDAVMVTIRKDQPINLVGAFEKPVKAGKNNENGYVESSADALIKHVGNVYQNWLGSPEKSFVVGEPLASLGEKLSLTTMLDSLSDEVVKHFENGGSVK